MLSKTAGKIPLETILQMRFPHTTPPLPSCPPIPQLIECVEKHWQWLRRFPPCQTPMSFHPCVPHPRGNSKGTGKTLNEACSLYSQYLPPDIPLKNLPLPRCPSLPQSFISFWKSLHFYLHLKSSAIWLPARPSTEAILLRIGSCIAQSS